MREEGGEAGWSSSSGRFRPVSSISRTSQQCLAVAVEMALSGRAAAGSAGAGPWRAGRRSTGVPRESAVLVHRRRLPPPLSLAPLARVARLDEPFALLRLSRDAKLLDPCQFDFIYTLSFVLGRSGKSWFTSPRVDCLPCSTCNLSWLPWCFPFFTSMSMCPERPGAVYVFLYHRCLLILPWTYQGPGDRDLSVGLVPFTFVLFRVNEN